MVNPFETLLNELGTVKEHLLKIDNKLSKTPETTSEERYLTTDQVCELLSVNRVTLWKWDNKNITKPIRIGNLKRYRLSDIEKMGTNKL